MWSFQALCDEFYVSTRLFLKLDLVPARESLLHFFEQIRRAFPSVSRFRRRDDGGLVLDEEERDGSLRRFVRLDGESLRMGCYNPTDPEQVEMFAGTALHLAPPLLSLSDLDYSHLDVALGFDLEYSGNHDELVADTLFADHPLVAALAPVAKKTVDCQPYLGVAVTDDCSVQSYLEIKSRTSTYEVRSGEFETSALSVLVTARRYWGFGNVNEPEQVLKELLDIGSKLASERVVPLLVKPLAAAIASRR